MDGGHKGSAAGGQIDSGSSGDAIKLYTLPLGTPEDLTTILQVVCRLTGQRIAWTEVTNELLASK